MSRIDDAIERCSDQLDRESEPSKMSIQEAIDFWEGIIAEAQGRLDALRADLENAEPMESQP
jgi:hypothetical protein